MVEYKEKLKHEGFPHIYEWTDKPYTKYPAHAHKGKVSFYIVRGALTMNLEGKRIDLKAGDYFSVPIGVVHTAEVGSDGCTFVVGEQISGDS